MDKQWISLRKYGVEQGIILLTTLLFISLISTMVLALWLNILILWKSETELISRQKALYDLEAAAKKILIVPKPECFKEIGDLNQSFKVLHQGCTVKFKHKIFFYVFSHIETSSCLQIFKKNEFFGSEHVVLTLAEELKTDVLQLRFTFPIAAKPCWGKIKLIKGGILSWRFITKAD